MAGARVDRRELSAPPPLLSLFSTCVEKDLFWLYTIDAFQLANNQREYKNSQVTWLVNGWFLSGQILLLLTRKKMRRIFKEMDTRDRIRNCGCCRPFCSAPIASGTPSYRLIVTDVAGRWSFPSTFIVHIPATCICRTAHIYTRSTTSLIVYSFPPFYLLLT